MDNIDSSKKIQVNNEHKDTKPMNADYNYNITCIFILSWPFLLVALTLNYLLQINCEEKNSEPSLENR